MSQRVRGQEVSLQIVVDGDLKRGSFAKASNFNLTPRTDIMETPFLGETEDDLDIQHHGYDFDFELHMEDQKAYDVLKDIVAREQNRLAHPAVDITVAVQFRDLANPTLIFTMERCFLKMDSMGFGGRKEYVTTKFSGKCKVVTTQ